MSIRRISLRTKMLLIVGGITFAALAMAGIAHILYERHALKVALVEEIAVLGKIIADRSTAALLFNDQRVAGENLGALAVHPSIDQACIYDAQDTLFASYVRERPGVGNCPEPPLPQRPRFHAGFMELGQSVAVEGASIGSLYLRANLRRLGESTANSVMVAVLSLFSVIVFAVLAAYRLQRLVTEPIRRLAATAARVTGSGDYGLSAERTSSDETGELVDAFNAMLETVRVQNASLKASETKYRGLVDQASDALFLVDLDGKVLEVNRRASLSLGYGADELLAMGITDIDVTLTTAAMRERIEAVRARGRTLVEGEFRRKDGSRFPVEIHSGLIDTGNSTHILAQVRDITERKRVERELRRHRDHLQELVEEQTAGLKAAKEAAELANAAKSEFLANMSHELRTPMHAILSFAAMGEEKVEKAAPDKLLRYFSRIRESGRRLLDLLNDLLDLSKLEAGRMNFDFKVQDLREVVDRVAAEFEALLAERDLVLETELPRIDTRILIDAERLTQVIRNLLSNASKFTPPGKRIRISYEAASLPAGRRASDTGHVPALSFRIADQGVGIPEEELERVFDKFEQSSKTRTKAGGTGLGLAICKQIVEAHRGIVFAANNADGGATFVITLPR